MKLRISPAAAAVLLASGIFTSGLRAATAPAAIPFENDAAFNVTLSNPNAVTSGGQHHLPERGTESDSSGQVRYEGPRSSSSVRSNLNAETSGGDASQVTDSGSSGRVYSGGVNGEDMRNLYNENQARLKEHAGEYSGPQNEIQQKVAGQRSENEQNINNSAGEIGKKQSTVQASSDILKGEDLSAQGKFLKGHKEAEIDQQMPIVDSAKRRELEQQLAELKNKTR